jgi:hypothetical protein
MLAEKWKNREHGSLLQGAPARRAFRPAEAAKPAAGFTGFAPGGPCRLPKL